LNHVVSRTLALEGEGQVNAYAGGYDDWLWQRTQPPDATPGPRSASSNLRPRPEAPRPPKIGFQEKQELDALPQHIEELEAEQQQLYGAMADPRLYQENGADVVRLQARLDELARALEAAYQRWEELDALLQ
jgi:ATP-binding cassette subfamily F protein uup